VVGYTRLAKSQLMRDVREAFRKLYQMIDDPATSAAKRAEAQSLVKTIDEKLTAGVKNLTVDNGNIPETNKEIHNLQRSLESNLRRASTLSGDGNSIKNTNPVNNVVPYKNPQSSD
jgi:hypothetical protein